MRARVLAVLTCATFAATGLAVAPDAVAAGDYNISVTVTPTKPHVDDTLTVSGVVTDAGGAPAPGVAVSVTRTDRNGTQPPFPPDPSSTPTGTDGAYTATDPQPAVWGTISYVVTVVADMSGSAGHASVYASRHPAPLTIAASRRIVLFRHNVTVTAHLGTTETNRTVTIYKRQYEGDRKQIASGTVDATSGKRSVSSTVFRRTIFSAHFAGDDKYAPATAYVTVRAWAVVPERLRGYYATSGAYRIYHRGHSPELDARLWPNQYHVCLYFRAQYKSGGRWHYASLSPCVRTASDGRAAALLNNALALPYRLRAEWRGNKVAAANHGPWLHLRFGG